MAARFKAWVCGRSLAGIVGSNPTGNMDVRLECCVLSGRRLCDELITRPKGYYRLWVRRFVWSRNLVNEEALALGGCCTKNKQTNVYNKKVEKLHTEKERSKSYFMKTVITFSSNSGDYEHKIPLKTQSPSATELGGWVVDLISSYSKGSGFKYKSCLSFLRFPWYPSVNGRNFRNGN